MLGLGLKQERRKKKKKLTHGKRPEQKKSKKYYNTIRIATHATTFTIPLPTRRSSSHPPRLLFRTAAAATNKISGGRGRGATRGGFRKKWWEIIQKEICRYVARYWSGSKCIHLDLCLFGDNISDDTMSKNLCVS